MSIGHWAGLVPENAAKHDVLAELLAAGALGFKSFMSPSGEKFMYFMAPFSEKVTVWGVLGLRVMSFMSPFGEREGHSAGAGCCLEALGRWGPRASYESPLW